MRQGRLAHIKYGNEAHVSNSEHSVDKNGTNRRLLGTIEDLETLKDDNLLKNQNYRNGTCWHRVQKYLYNENKIKKWLHFTLLQRSYVFVTTFYL